MMKLDRWLLPINEPRQTFRVEPRLSRDGHPTPHYCATISDYRGVHFLLFVGTEYLYGVFVQILTKGIHLNHAERNRNARYFFV